MAKGARDPKTASTLSPTEGEGENTEAVNRWRNTTTPANDSQTGDQIRQPRTHTREEADRGESEWLRHYGDKRVNTEETESDTARISTHNINSFPRMGSIKMIRMKQEAKNIEVMGVSELNRNWLKIPAQESNKNRTQHWWATSKTKTAWLRDAEWPSTHQQGGVSITVQGKLVPFSQNSGEDKAGLGRWVWTTLEGRSDRKLVIIQIYRPCKNENDAGSTYNQQKAWMDDPQPIKTFDRELLEMIDIFRSEKFQVIVMGDFNMPMRGEESSLEKEMTHRGIIDHVQRRYGRHNAPSTHQRGSAPIDAIRGSDTLEMIKGGYDEGMNEISDHRLVWADFSMDSMLGVNRGKFHKPASRKLQATNKKVTARFNMLLEHQIDEHNILEKAEGLEDEIGKTRTMTTRQEEIYEILDDQRDRAVQHANQNCCKLPSADREFSPTFQLALGTSIIQQELLKKTIQKKKINTRWIQNMKDRWGIKKYIAIPTDIAQAREEAAKAHDQFKEIKKNTPELRREFLDMLIQQAEDRGLEDKAKEIRGIRDRERIREVHRRIKYAQGKIRGGGVKFVEQITEDGERRTIKDKDAMERAIIKANENKLHSADESPLRQGALSDLLTDNDDDKWEQFLRGELQLPDNMEEGTRRWLESFHREPLQDEHITLTVEEYTRSWAKPREHTACAPGALHFGTFKAMKGSAKAAKLHTIMARIPIATGYTPKRWNRCVDSMLPKKPNEWRPEKLRLTALLMPDFNHNNKILGRAAMRWAEGRHSLAMEQYGSRKKLSAAKHALNKRILLDILRTQKRPGVICANDAKACYDRILHFAAYVSLRKAGLTQEAATSMINPIRQLTHTIRTAYGDSNTTYGGAEWTREPSGICQGNGAGPAIWALVSSPLLKMLREANYGAKLQSATGPTNIHLSGFAFVDDADTIQTGEHGETTETVMTQAQRQLNLWEQGIRATGGGIEGSKSDFAVINFEWCEGQWKYEDRDNTNKLSIPNARGGRDYLEQLRADESRRTLGVWQAVDGNEDEQTKQMKEKAEKWASNIRHSSLSRDDIAMGIKTSLYPSITFGLMATAITKEQGAEVFKPIRKDALSPLGYNKHIPWQVVHGPTKYGGMEIRDIYSIQGIEHVKILLDEADTQSPTAKLLRILQHDHLLEIGRPRFILDHNFAEVGHMMTSTWYKNTLEFISDSNIKIKGTQDQLEKWREDDEFIMEDFLDTPGYIITKEDMQAANRCRIYMRALTRSDISHGNGQRILKAAWHVLRDWKSPSSRAYKWPLQPRPPIADRRRWQRLLAATYGVDQHHLGWARRLHRWRHEAKQHITWWHDRTEDHLYEKTEAGWHRWTKIARRTRTQGFTRAQDTMHTPPGHAHPAVVTQQTRRDIVYMEGFDRHTTMASIEDTDEIETDTDTVINPDTLLGEIHQYHTSLHWALEDVKLPDDEGKAIAHNIRNNKMEVVCDGSLKNGFGTSAAIVKNMPDRDTYTVCNRVTGTTDDQSSYRSELCGILSHIMMINAIAKLHRIETGTVTLGCDNETSIWSSFGKDQITATDASHDVLQVIKHQLKASPVKWKYRHIQSHQDRHKKLEELDDWERTNVEADRLATQYWNQQYTNAPRRPLTTRMPGEGWRVTIEGEPVIHNIADRIYARRYRKPCTEYWEKKGRILPNQSDHIDWEAYQDTIRITPRSKPQWTHKHFCGFEATNYMLHKFGERLTPACPQCEEDEKHTHILQCKSEHQTQAFAGIIDGYTTWVARSATPSMTAAIHEMMEAYRDGREAQTQQSWADDVREAFELQTAIGPRAFVEGLITPKWQQIQKRHMQLIGSNKSPRRWIKELILKTWMVSWDMWDSRNGIVHNNKETRRQQIMAALDEDIRGLHQFAQDHRFLTKVARNFFAKPLEEILKDTDYQRRIWRRLGERYLENDRKRMTSNRSAALMREWLDPGAAGRRRPPIMQISEVVQATRDTTRAPLRGAPPL